MNNETDIKLNNCFYNLDLLKALSIICMILCHAVLQLGLHRTGYSQDIPYIFGILLIFLSYWMAKWIKGIQQKRKKTAFH